MADEFGDGRAEAARVKREAAYESEVIFFVRLGDVRSPGEERRDRDEKRQDRLHDALAERCNSDRQENARDWQSFIFCQNEECEPEPKSKQRIAIDKLEKSAGDERRERDVAVRSQRASLVAHRELRRPRKNRGAPWVHASSNYEDQRGERENVQPAHLAVIAVSAGDHRRCRIQRQQKRILIPRIVDDLIVKKRPIDHALVRERLRLQQPEGAAIEVMERDHCGDDHEHYERDDRDQCGDRL